MRFGRRALRHFALLATLLCTTSCAKHAVCKAGAACSDPDASVFAPQKREAGARTFRVDAACATQAVRGERLPTRKVDIIFVIDNSGSMSDEIAAVRQNINQNFANVISASGVDFRVVMLSLFGTQSTSICVEPPLSGASCADGLLASTSDVFFHYNIEIDSNNAFCQILESFDRADPENRAPDGWQGFLRPEAEKDFVVISDDSASCVYQRGKQKVSFGANDDPFDQALLFHQTLLAKSPAQFGISPDIRYRFFSIVGMGAHSTPTEPWFPYEGLESTACDTAPSPGLSYQALSIVTDALRYPVCDGRGFDAVFQALARSVLSASQADCVYALPEAPPRQVIDRTSVNVEYLPGDGGPVRHWAQIASSESCQNDHSFHVGDKIELCPDACAALQRDPAAEVNIVYACTMIPE